MLVRLTFVKRFTSDGFLYRRERAYRVTDEHATRLMQVDVNDMPVFKMVDEDTLPEGVGIIDLVAEEEEEVVPVPVKKPRKIVEKEEPAPKKKVAVKKARIKSAAPVKDDNIEMV